MTYPIVLESIINIVLAVIVYKYLDNLKKIQCTCALQKIENILCIIYLQVFL